MMDSSFLWLPRTKATQKAKCIFGLISHSIKKKERWRSKFSQGRLGKPPFPSPPKEQSCNINTREVRRGEGSQLLLTLLIHRKSSPNRFFIPLILSPSARSSSILERSADRSDMEPNTAAMGSASGLSLVTLGHFEDHSCSQQRNHSEALWGEVGGGLLKSRHGPCICI